MRITYRYGSDAYTAVYTYLVLYAHLVNTVFSALNRKFGRKTHEKIRGVSHIPGTYIRQPVVTKRHLSKSIPGEGALVLCRRTAPRIDTGKCVDRAVACANRKADYKQCLSAAAETAAAEAARHILNI